MGRYLGIATGVLIGTNIGGATHISWWLIAALGIIAILAGIVGELGSQLKDG